MKKYVITAICIIASPKINRFSKFKVAHVVKTAVELRFGIGLALTLIIRIVHRARGSWPSMQPNLSQMSTKHVAHFEGTT